MNLRQPLFFLLALLLLLAGRLAIAGSGYLEDTDEWLYLWMHENMGTLDSLKTWVDGIFYMQGQLPEMLLRFLQYCSVLPIAEAMQLSPLHPEVLYYIGWYNIAASLLLLVVFYGILLRIGFSRFLATVGLLLLGTLFNYNLHSRHILPYDHAMLFHLTAFYVLLSTNLRPKNILQAGLFSALGLVTYYGSFIFIFINGGLVVVRYWSTARQAAKHGALYALPFVGVYLAIELLSRFYGQSYFAFVTQYSGTVNMASADEGFSYIFYYFYHVEKAWGMVLLGLFAAGSGLVFGRADSLHLKQILLLGIVAYLSYGAVAFFTHKLVFHGRLLHPYYPFIIIGVLGWVRYQRLVRPAYLGMGLAALALANYALVVQDFNRIGYPRQAIYAYGLYSGDARERMYDYVEELPSVSYSDRAMLIIDSMGKSSLPEGNYTLVNVGFLAHYPDSVLAAYQPYVAQQQDTMLVSLPHFQSHPAYAMEYCTCYGREFFWAKQFRIQVIKKHSP